jgi:hypothetical protein
MRRHAKFPQGCDKVLRVIRTIGSDSGSACAAWNFAEHVGGCFALRSSGGQRDARVDDQPVAVFRDEMAEIAQFRFRTPRLLVQSRGPDPFSTRVYRLFASACES